MKTRSIYNRGTGFFTGGVVAHNDNSVFGKLEPELGEVEGQHDHLSKRVDLATGEVIEWQPPAPPDTDLETFEWDALSEPKRPRWRARPTAKALVRAENAAIVAQIEREEAKQTRSIRELALTPSSKPAKDALQAIENKVAELRATLQPEP